jgi:GT2 family glycosyltransferase
LAPAVRATVVIPTHNRREGLRRALLALFASDLEGIELDVRVVDDGSTDATPEVAEQLCAGVPPQVRLHYHRQVNQGQSAARNTGIAAAETELILFLDDDCVPDPGWVRAMIAAAWEPRVGAVGGRIAAAAGGNQVSRYCRHIRYNEYPPDDGPLRFVNSANCAYRRQALEAVGGYEPLLLRGVDHDLGRRLLEAGWEIRCAPEALVHHHHRESLRILVRDYYRRGYWKYLRELLFHDRNPPDSGEITRESARALLLTLGVFLTPFAALRGRKEIPPVDRLPFAVLEWLVRTASRWGKLAMMRRVAAGRQPLTRSRHLSRINPNA